MTARSQGGRSISLSWWQAVLDEHYHRLSNPPNQTNLSNETNQTNLSNPTKPTNPTNLSNLSNLANPRCSRWRWAGATVPCANRRRPGRPRDGQPAALRGHPVPTVCSGHHRAR
ncbi:MAG: hypothetical protein AB7H88_14315 [Vicinamibacterales bacterium]